MPRVETPLGWSSRAQLDTARVPTKAFLARQPILDTNLQTTGYELLYRNGQANSAQITDPIHATSTVLTHLFADFGLERVVGRVPAWVNFPAEYLTAGVAIPIPPSGLVVELLQGFKPTARLLHRLRKLKVEGCQLALDDYVDDPQLEPFVRLADFVKVSVQGKSASEMAQQVAALARFGVMLVATRVETMDEFETCKGLGFQRFQGYFVTKPQLLEGNKSYPIRMGLARVMAELHAPNPDIRRVEQLVAQDAGLSLQLLRFLNSSVYALPTKVESISHAVMMLGLAKLKNLLGLLQVNQVEDRPPALVEMALVRAKMVELLGAGNGLSSESGFTVGLFSVLDAMLHQPMDQVLADLPLHADLKSALIERGGEYGRLLSVIEAHERADEARVVELGVEPDLVTQVWIEAVAWARTITTTLADDTKPSGPKVAARKSAAKPRGR